VVPIDGMDLLRERKIFAPVVKAVLLDVLCSAFIIKALIDKQTFVFVTFSSV
jgi:hypothetical protein